MRSFISLGLPLAVLAAVIPPQGPDAALDKRQFDWLAKLTPNQKAFKIIDGKTDMTQPGVKRATIWYGPYIVAAANSSVRTGNTFTRDPAGTGFSYAAEDWPRDATVLKTNVITAYEDGTKADVSNGIYNHHVSVMDTNRGQRNWIGCGGSSLLDKLMSYGGDAPIGGSILVGGSEDKYGNYYSSQDGTFKSGYYVGPKDRITMSGDLINYTNEQKNVYVIYDIDYIPGKQQGYDEAGLYMVSPGLCDGRPPIVFANKDTKQLAISGSPIKITRDGHLLNLRGHLHDGGENIAVGINGKEICSSNAVYGGSDAKANGPEAAKGWETISQMSPCFGPIKVSKGDNLTIVANFDLEKHPQRMQHGGNSAEMMAMMVIFFAVSL